MLLRILREGSGIDSQCSGHALVCIFTKITAQRCVCVCVWLGRIRGAIAFAGRARVALLIVRWW